MKSARRIVREGFENFLTDPIVFIMNFGCSIVILLGFMAVIIPLAVDLVKEILAAFK